MFDDNENEDWGRYNYGGAAAVAPPPQSAGPGYAPWTDPDTAPPDLANPNQQPAGNPGDGNYWGWDGSRWVIRQMARGPQTTAPPPGVVTPPVNHNYGDPPPPSGSGQFDYGRPMGNQFSAYHPLNYPQFSFGEFKPTNRDDLYNEQLNPGFSRGQDRLKKQIEGGAAYQGMLRSGMTFDRLGSILGNNEEQQFTSFDNRRARDYGINRDNMAGAWTMNQGMAERDNQRGNDYRFNTEDSTQRDILSRWSQLVSSATQLSKPS